MFPTSPVSDRSSRKAERGAKPKTKVKNGKRFCFLLLGMSVLSCFVSGLSGCMTLHNGWEALRNNGAWNETVLVLRNRSFAVKAWHRRKHNFCRERYLKDFCAGFRAGYEDVANGGGECTPAFPPQSYWGWEYQSAEGQARTAAWFAGYPHGARAAEEDGVASWSQISMSTGMQAQYQQAGVFEHEGAIYPIPQEGANPVMNDTMGGYPFPNTTIERAEPIIPTETNAAPQGLLDPTTP